MNGADGFIQRRPWFGFAGKAVADQGAEAVQLDMDRQGRRQSE
jgi:hypothetical protein